MLSKQENELLTRVGPGTPMGNLLRLYWQPAILSSELPEADGNPIRLRLLGEDLIAFRNSDGQVGVVENHCPHRGASLYFGRNEENGLRCVYHGWKFDIAGNCVDMPNEPPESNFKEKVHHTAYPAVERNGLIWTYMGPENPPPLLPALEWSLVAPEQSYLTKRWSEANWVQVLEGEIDSSHSGFLHTVLDEEANYNASKQSDYWKLTFGDDSKGMVYKMRDKHPHFEVLDTEYGVLIGARRVAEGDSFYWRVTQFLMPFHTIVPPYGSDPILSGHAWVPIDDENTMCLTFHYHPLRALTEKEIYTLQHGGGPLGEQGLHPTVDAFLAPTSEAGSQFRCKYNKTNDYGIEWDAQRSLRYSGLPGIWPQDAALQESMGAIYDRSQEHLGTSDTAIIRTRRVLMEAAKALRERGEVHPSVHASEAYKVRTSTRVIPRSENWVEGIREFLVAQPDVHFAAV